MVVAGVGYVSAPVPGSAARKVYTCPRCLQDVLVGQAHVVAFPDEQPDFRRHWHSACWAWFVRHGRDVVL